MEELKIIIEAVKATSDATLNFAIWWLVKDLIYSLCCIGAVMVGLILTYKVFKPIVASCIENDFVKDLRRFVCPAINHGFLSEHEKQAIIDAVKRGMRTKE
jgi:hypothetical protein